MDKDEPQAAVRWKTLDYPSLLMEEWEGEVFLFNPASGDTHILNALAVDVLRRLSTRSATTAELQALLIASHQPDDADLFARHLAEHLAQLDGLGLIAPENA